VHTPDLDDVFFALTGPAHVPNQPTQPTKSAQSDQSKETAR
jgi:ABC-2 type transport system ATP-binding protein